MFYTPKHAKPTTASPARRRVAGVAVAGATAAAGSVATAGSASAETVWDRVAQCESGGNWSINTGNGFYGGLQFTSQTWRGFGGGTYAAYAHQATKAQQIAIAQKVLKVQGPGAWPVCSVRAGLTRANGAASGGGDTTASRTTTRTSTSTKLVVDGVRGPATNRAIEKWARSRQAHNGVLTPKWEVHRMQRKLGIQTRNGNINDAQMIRAIQGMVGVQKTGSWNTTTIAAFQRHLNKVNG